MVKNMEIEHVCPVCGKYMFEEEDSFDYCPVCGWGDDKFQEENPDYKGGYNRMSLNQAREAYANGKEII